MRKQFRGLQGIISGKYNRYLTQDEAFIFIGKTRTTAKILHRESNVSLIISKRPRMKICTNCFLNFGKTKTESTNIYL